MRKKGCPSLKQVAAGYYTGRALPLMSISKIISFSIFLTPQPDPPTTVRHPVFKKLWVVRMPSLLLLLYTPGMLTIPTSFSFFTDQQNVVFFDNFFCKVIVYAVRIVGNRLNYSSFCVLLWVRLFFHFRLAGSHRNPFYGSFDHMCSSFIAHYISRVTPVSPGSLHY